MTLFNTLFFPSLASSVYQKGNLSHAIIAENKGDEVLCTKKGGDQSAVMKTDYVVREASSPEVGWDWLGPDSAQRHICGHTLGSMQKA
jgi:hypothetical protein